MLKFWQSNTFKLVVLFCISVLIRVIPMRKWVYGMDEAMHLIEISYVLSKDFQGAKPGYAFLLTFITVLSGTQNPTFIRLITIFFAGLLVFIGYSFGKKLGGTNVGMFTAIFLTFHHKIFDLSYWIMTDIPFTFLSFLALYFIYRNVETLEALRNNEKLSILAGVLCGLSYLFRQVGVYLIILGVIGYFIFHGSSFLEKIKNGAGLFFGLIFMLTPWFLWNYLHYGVLDVTVNFVDFSIILKLWPLILLSIGLCGIIVLTYKKIEFSTIQLVLFIIVGTIIYALILFLYLYQLLHNVFLSRLIFYLVQIPGVALGFHLINPYGVTYLAITISIITFLVLLSGLVRAHKRNKSLTLISVISSVLLILLLCGIIFQSERYMYPLAPLVSTFLIMGVLKLKEVFFFHIAQPILSSGRFFKKPFYDVPVSSSQIVTISFFIIILTPNIVADGLANEYYLSFDEMVVTSPLWREYITSALWFRENSDPQARVLVFKNFDFEYYSHRPCMAPHPQIYDEYYKNFGAQAYITELMKIMNRRNITHIVFGPFGYSDRLLFWISDPNTAPSYLDVIYLVDSPKVVIYRIDWSKYTASTSLG